MVNSEMGTAGGRAGKSGKSIGIIAESGRVFAPITSPDELASGGSCQRQWRAPLPLLNFTGNAGVCYNALNKIKANLSC